jgi:hypothetical protein
VDSTPDSGRMRFPDFGLEIEEIKGAPGIRLHMFYIRQTTLQIALSVGRIPPEHALGRCTTVKQTISPGQATNRTILVSRSKSPNTVEATEKQLVERRAPTMILLCIGLHPALLRTQRAIWKSAGCVVATAASIPKAIVTIAAGDFDLVLLGERLPIEDRKRLTLLIRSMGFGVPVVCISDTCGRLGFSSNTSPQNDSETVLCDIPAVLAGNATPQPVVNRRNRPA